MRTFFSNKIWVGFVSLLGLAALMWLALGLKSMSFRNGQTIGRDQAQANQGLSQLLTGTETLVPFHIQVLFFVLVVLLVALITMLMSPEGRKRLLRMLFRAAVTYLVIYMLVTRYPNVLEQIGDNLFPQAGGTPSLATTQSPPVFTPPESSSWLSYAVTILLTVLTAYGLWKFYTLWRELNEPEAEDSKKKLAAIVRSSLRQLSANENSTDVIMGCYYRMSEAVAHKKNLERGVAMTPAEFAVRLERSGIPAEAVRRLTQLFEAVRYGGYKSSPTMVHEAVACLTTILHYCGETA